MEFVDKFRKNVTIDYSDLILDYSHQIAYIIALEVILHK
jgi:hypothetical protein